jgi:vitamin B12 transporter
VRRIVQSVTVDVLAVFVLSLASRAAAQQAEAQPAPDAGVPDASDAQPLELEEAPEVTVTTAAPAPAPKAAASSSDVPEIIVTGERIHESQRLVQSAESVQVVDTRRAQQQTSDLGEVLARVQGVGVRREGGLGSTVRFSLNGLTDDQVRFFMDGVPLDQAGFPFGIANVPVNLIERVEIYRGVVPVRFGADALGGAVNLVSPDVRQNYLGGSYQIGSFGTHRATVDGRYHDADSGFVFGHTAFLDVAKNDYKVLVDVPQRDGSLVPRNVPRFHDAYRAFGARLEAGVVDRKWAKRLLLSGYASSFDKEVQHNLWMTGAPFGEATYRQDVYGVTARYEVRPVKQLELSALANYSYTTFGLRDVSPNVYDWNGDITREKPNRRQWGEITDSPSDQLLKQHAWFGRVLAGWDIASEHAVRLSLRPGYVTRTGDNRVDLGDGAADGLNAHNGLFTLVAGLEYQINLIDDMIENIAFVKDYLYRAEVEELLTGGAGLSALDVNKHTQGFGDVLRVRASEWLDIKLAYEYATRLPRPDELFGNGGLVLPNVKLEPEVSHNVNIGPHLAWKRTPIGKIVIDVNGFLRDIDRLILLGGGGRSSRYQNVYGARSLGLESALSWSAPAGIVNVDGTFTWQDFRNTSSEGEFGDVKGDRVPNRPYMFGSWGARLRFDDIIVKLDSIEPFYVGRYVHSFFLSWESLGRTETKLGVPDQVTHDIGVTWNFENDVARTSATLEVQNVTDARVYDNLGVQRPGRAFFAKVTASFR